MVGVPGRSKACLTCRRRKKGCDLQQPACGQCRRAAIECGGYERQRIFIHKTQAEAHGKALRLETDIGPQQSLIRLEAGPQQAMVILPESLTQSAYGDKFLELYWGSYLPNGRSFSAEAAKYSTAGWMNVVQDLHQQDKPLHMALMANCMGLVGRGDGQKWMVEESLRVYGLALKAVVSSLRDPVKMESNELLVASRLLSLFELCFGADEVDHPAQSQRWSAHIAGGMAIMASRKPFAYIRGHAHSVFVDSRLHQIINDIQLRRPSFLSEPAWKNIPWLEEPKDPKDVLLDVLVDIPGILGEFDSMQSCIDLKEREKRRGELYSRCLEYDKELQAWASNIGRPAMDFIVKKLAEGDLENQTPTSEELSMAHLGIIHCITCILLYHVLHSTTTTTKASTTPERMNPRAYCRRMARLLPLFLARNAGGFVISMVTFPVGMALSYLRVGDASRHLVSEEQQMLLRVFEGEYGAEIRRFLVSRQRDRQEIV
ncbi:hypothetical protein EDB81DRAFT_76298 [Dactylonectria macrodidyma]|uniref:Zn(2)-C6 fungal-type domain-containing protein n=1 Tax=Dactylonectria macrodidyma TaxID=307937 RepID=A0A9P9EHS9_9HYPO|nr:hypothetical protein EDB81DRAFT_76298 [Dactylonectria macrodidyma]